jgi:hypothetical protein
MVAICTGSESTVVASEVNPNASKGQRTTAYWNEEDQYITPPLSFLSVKLTDMLKWPISEVGRRSFAKCISPSRYRVVDVLRLSDEGHQTADAMSSTVSFHATSCLDEDVWL